MRTARVGLAMTDQRPLMRRSREDNCRDRPNSGQSISLRAGIGSFSVSVPDATCNATGKDDRSAHLHQARTPVFGHGARISLRIGASLLKLAPRGSAAVALDLPLRGGVSRMNAPQADLCLRKCERCQIAHSRTAAVSFETSSAISDLARFAVHHQKLREEGWHWHGSCSCDAATLSKG